MQNILLNWNYMNTRIVRILSFAMLQQRVHCLLDVNHIINSIISKKIIRAYQGRDEDAVKYVKKVKALIDKPLDEMGCLGTPGPSGPIELGHVRLAMAKVKCPRKLDILCSIN